MKLLGDEGVDAAIVALLVRLPGLSSAGKADAVSESVREHGREMAEAFTVVSSGLVRMRPLL